MSFFFCGVIGLFDVIYIYIELETVLILWQHHIADDKIIKEQFFLDR